MTHYHHTHITTPTLTHALVCKHLELSLSPCTGSERREPHTLAHAYTQLFTFGHENNLSLTAPASGVQTFSVKSKEGGKKGATKDATIGVTRDGLMLLDPVTGP